MERVEIRNIGPIREVAFDINKVNVIIGPQSSGKSTIAKVVCFCQWIEKNIILHQDVRHITDEFVAKHFVDFHQFSNYVNADTYILYENDFIRFVYNGGAVSIQMQSDVSNAKLSKIAYIPSERNIVTMPVIASLPLPFVNLRSFVFDWLEIHSKFTEANPVGLLNLGIDYHFDKSSNSDVITLKNGKSLNLSEASSGVQSIVPLYVYMKYYTEWIYSHQEDRSFEENAIVSDTLTKALVKAGASEEKVSDAGLSDLMKSDAFRQQAETIFRRLRNIDVSILQKDQSLLKLRQLEDNIIRPHMSKITLEEPEQNLFPETQVSLLYDILRMADINRDNLFITTHSPYILYALNNSMLGWIVKDKISEEIKVEMDDIPFINPDNVSVWEIRDGKYHSSVSGEGGRLQDEKGLIRGNYFDRVMKNVMGQFTNLISFAD